MPDQPGNRVDHRLRTSTYLFVGESFEERHSSFGKVLVKIPEKGSSAHRTPSFGASVNQRGDVFSIGRVSRKRDAGRGCSPLAKPPEGS
jgi:hypothetical protein